MNPDLILHHIRELVTLNPSVDSSRDSFDGSAGMAAENPLGIIPQGAMAVEQGEIVWIGRSDEIHLSDYPDAMWINVHDQCVFPGLIDSHTHAIFAGNRADEFERRIQGATYQEIAKSGGGILKTVHETRQASEEQLYNLTRVRLENMLNFGVTTVEVKTGYGLDPVSELKCLKVLSQLQRDLPMTIVPTVMPAHDIPPEYLGKAAEYVTLVCEQILPILAEPGIAACCDVFCEEGYFTIEQSRRILETGRALGLKSKIHAEEFCNSGGAELAAEVGALSADHLLHVSDTGIRALARSGVVATLLPGTAFYLRLKEYAPARRLLNAGVAVALATDFNPGSCMTENLHLIMSLACLEMGMTPVEVFQAVTLNGAKALGLGKDRGTLAVGKRADFLIADISTYHEWLYHLGINPIRQVFIAGRLVAENPMACRAF